MSQVKLIRIRVQATVPTQPFGNVVLDVESTISLESGDRAAVILKEELQQLREFINRQLLAMPSAGPATWLEATSEVHNAHIEIAP